MISDKEQQIVGITRDQVQARRLPLRKGDITLSDGRKLREIIGYADFLRQQVKMNEATRKAIVQMRGWRHAPTNLLVTGSVNLTDRFGYLLHLSLSYPDHDPSWDEIKMIRYAFYPEDVDVMMVLPRVAHYVNVHEHCYQMYQCPQEWNIG